MNGDLNLSAAVAVWASWETLKAVGLPFVLKQKIFGPKSAYTAKERDEIRAHFEDCRRCISCQSEQVQLLRKISDTMIEIRTLLTHPIKRTL